MALLDLAISALKGRQQQLAIDALKTPRGRDSFDYGRVCGLYEGIGVALQLIEEILNDADQAELRA